MQKQIDKILGQLHAYLERAEELSDSGNEKTAARYESVAESLREAIDALDSIEWE